MTLKRISIKFLKITGIILGVIVILFTIFHLWFINHAKSLLEDAVNKKSNGKVKLTIEKLSYNYFNHRMKIKEAVFQNIDTASAPTVYKFDIKEIRLKLKALLPLIFEKKLLIDSLHLQSPDIQVTTLRYTKDTIKTKKEDISIPYEMGKVYKSIQDALKILHVNRFQIDDATFRLINRIQPGELPLNVNNIHFHIDNLRIDTAKLSGNEKLLFSDNVVLRSNNQNILFPDGRHRLAFSRFRINIRKKLVEFDSCTIEATKKDSSTSSFKVFFDALLLTNIDFDTLYKSDVIKADSVYCINPKFNLDVKLGKKKYNEKQFPKLENIIRELTGDLQLRYVVVANADFNIKTEKDGKPSTFTFSKNNFEIQGLSIDQNRPRPIKIENFVMAIRNYENFIRDSSYSVKFDSVLFKYDQIILSNFEFNKLKKGKISNSFSMPQFRLEGLSWDELVFEKKLKASEAIMIEPHINFTANDSRTKKGNHQNIFQSLGTIKEYMDLERLNVINGTIDLKLNENLRVRLENTSLSLQSQSLFASKKISGIKNSLSNLEFEKGIINAGNINMDLRDIIYNGRDGRFSAGSFNIKDKGNNMEITMHQVAVDKLQKDEVTGNIAAEGIDWQKAAIRLSFVNSKIDTVGSVFKIKKVHGSNTTFNGLFSDKTISTHFDHISFDELEKIPGKKIILSGLNTEGDSLIVNSNKLKLTMGSYNITDNKPSFFNTLKYETKNGNTNAVVSIPSMTAIPHLQSLISGEIAIDEISISKPVFDLHLENDKTSTPEKKSSLPKISINEIKIIQPRINFTQQKDSGLLSLTWYGETSPANFLVANNIQAGIKNDSAIDAGNIQFFLSDLIFSSATGKTFNTGNGKITAQLKDLGLILKKKEPLNWNVLINSFTAKDFRLDSLKKSGGTFVINNAEIKDVQLSSSTINNLKQLFSANPLFHLNKFTGQYATPQINLIWYNAGFDRISKTFSLDSFSYSPAMGIDSFLATKKYQTDYIKVTTKAMHIGPLDFERFIKDSILDIRKIQIENLHFVDFKDKNLPFNSGIIKPMPVDLIRKIPFSMTCDSLVLNNGSVNYSEVTEKTKLTGTIPVTRMMVTLLNVKNYNHTSKDSLIIKATGYIMDTVWTRLRVKESYTDSTGRFFMTLRLKPGDLTLLNSALIPLASIKLLSGQLDTLSMRVIGREYLSLGEMKMFYKDLKIQLLKNDETSKKTFQTKLGSFIANTFIIKKNNSARIADVFFIRQRDRSAINYLIKIAFSGMASSVGARNNKKMIRKYRKESERRNLPVIELE